jgi:hypothetical protein
MFGYLALLVFGFNLHSIFFSPIFLVSMYVPRKSVKDANSVARGSQLP